MVTDDFGIGAGFYRGRREYIHVALESASMPPLPLKNPAPIPKSYDLAFERAILKF